MATAGCVFYTLCYVSLLTGTNWLLWMKRNFASNQWHEFRLKAAVQDFYEESGPSAILVLVNEAAWATCPTPPPPQLGPSPFPLLGGLGNQPFTGETTMTQKGIQCHQCPAWEISAALSILPLALLVSKSTHEPTVREPPVLIPLINGPLNWSLTSLHTCPKLLPTPETLQHTGQIKRFDFGFVSGHTDQEEKTNPQLYYHTITLAAKSLFFYSLIRTTTCFWLKYYTQGVFRTYKTIQNLFTLIKFHIFFQISNMCPT